MPRNPNTNIYKERQKWKIKKLTDNSTLRSDDGSVSAGHNAEYGGGGQSSRQRGQGKAGVCKVVWGSLSIQQHQPRTSPAGHHHAALHLLQINTYCVSWAAEEVGDAPPTAPLTNVYRDYTTTIFMVYAKMFDWSCILVNLHNYCSDVIDINMKWYILYIMYSTNLWRFQAVLVIISKYRPYMSIREKNLGWNA